MKISVAMASYNGEQYIRKQIESIIHQTMPVDEIIITDDCSTDHTYDILLDIQAKAQDISLNIIRNKENLGYKDNFKKAISLCTGDYIFLCDQDDYWNNNKVETLINIMQTNKISVLSSSFTFMDANDDYLEIKKNRGFSNNNMIHKVLAPKSLTHMNIDDLLFHNPCQGCAMLIDKQVAQEFVIMGDNALPHDWEINILGNKFDGTYFYNVPLFRYRIHSTNTIGINSSNAKDKVNEKIRIKAQEDALGAVNFTFKVGLKGKIDQRSLQQFLETNIVNLKSQKFFSVFKQQLLCRSYYVRLKPFLGRMADLVYTLK